jgi:hypothetical protein
VSNLGTEYDGQYGIQDDSLSAENITFGAFTSALVFTFNDDCSLIASSDNVATLPPGLIDSPLYFDAPYLFSDNGFLPTSCDIVNNPLRCVLRIANTFYVCKASLFSR